MSSASTFLGNAFRNDDAGMKHYKTALRFSLVGVLNTTLDFAIFVSLIQVFDISVMWANVIAYVVAVTNSFLINRIWTFRGSKTQTHEVFPAYIRFVAVNSVGMLLGTIVIYILMPILRVEIAKVVSISVSLVWNYFGSSRWVFMSKEVDER